MNLLFRDSYANEHISQNKNHGLYHAIKIHFQGGWATDNKIKLKSVTFNLDKVKFW